VLRGPERALCVITFWLPGEISAQAEAYGEAYSLNLQEQVIAGLIYVLKGDPDITRTYMSMKGLPQAPGETDNHGP
jgi:hypothetical protein